MNELVAIIAIAVCLVAVIVALKIYKESPLIKKDKDPG